MGKILSRLFSPSIAYDGEIREIRDLQFNSVADKVAFIRAAILRGADDPLVREVTAKVLLAYGARPRDFRSQVDAIQRYCRDNIYYLNERKETFQSAAYTLQHLYGDCDDATICSGAMLETITIPTRIEILGEKTQEGVLWKHIYLRAGLPPSRPTEWIVVECTVKGAGLDFEPAAYARALKRGAKGHGL